MDLVTLHELFERRLFRIPDYQRGYAWGEREYGAFWQDLCRMGDERRHYTGQLTVRAVPVAESRDWIEERHLLEDGGNYNPYYIVDGQQRLTTAIILLKCLLDHMEPSSRWGGSSKAELETKYLYHSGALSRVFLFGYAVGSASYEYFKVNVLGQTSTEVHQAESVYTMNLRDARAYFADKLADKPPGFAEQIFRAVTIRCLFNWNELVEGLDEFVVFETMNNRGKKVSDLELLKNRLIHLTANLPTVVPAPDCKNLRKRINTAWATAYENLGCERDATLNDDEAFLRHHSTMVFERWWGVPDYILAEHFTTDRVDKEELTLEQLDAYVTSIQAASKAWRFVHAPLLSPSLPAAAQTELERIGRLGHGAFVPLFLAALQHFDKEAETQTELVAQAERFRFTVGALCRRKANTGENHFYNLATRLFHKHQHLKGAIQEIRDWSDRFFKIDRAVNESEDRFRHRDGFYTWSGIRYLLYEYEQYLRKEKYRMEATKLDWQKLHEHRSDYVTIEHIYPVTPRAGDWPRFEQFDEGQLHRLNHSLGNLLPLSRSRNSSLSNRPFSTKCGDERRHDGVTIPGYSSGCYSEIDVSKRAHWTPESILKRGLEMVQFIEDRWDIDMGTRMDQVRFLGLEFLVPPEAGDSGA